MVLAANSSPGMYITFAGVDGSGKSTQADLLLGALRQAGKLCYLADNLEGSSFQILERVAAGMNMVDYRKIFAPEYVEFLFMMDALRHIDSFVVPQVSHGATVITSRSMLRRLGIAGFYRCKNMNDLKRLAKEAMTPDIHFFIDTEPEQALARIVKRGKDIETIEYLRSFREQLVVLGSEHNVVLINGNRPAEEIHAEVLELTLKAYQKKNSALLTR